MSESHDCVPIVSGNVKYLGLTVPEITINFVLLCPYFVIGQLSWTILIWIAVIIIIDVVYVQFFSKLEENFFYVIQSYREIPEVIWGFSNTLPIREFRNDTSTASMPFVISGDADVTPYEDEHK